MGESVLSFVGPDDRDRRPLPAVLDDLLGPGTSLLAVHGGGYHAELLAAYVDLMRGRPAVPRVVVVPLWVRGRLRPWVEHPRFGHVEALRRLRRARPRHPALAGARLAAPADAAPTSRASTACPTPPCSGRLDGRRLRAAAQGAAASRRPERLRLLYAYHHGRAGDRRPRAGRR